MLNGLGASVLAIVLVTRRPVLGALGLSAGALVAVLISTTDTGLFDYAEPTFRTAVAVAAEAAAVVLLTA